MYWQSHTPTGLQGRAVIRMKRESPSTPPRCRERQEGGGRAAPVCSVGTRPVRLVGGCMPGKMGVHRLAAPSAGSWWENDEGSQQEVVQIINH